MWLLVGCYCVAVVLLHEEVQLALTPLFHRWTYYGYELRLVVAWFLLGTPLAIAVTLGIYRAHGWRGLGGWAALVVAICIMDQWFLFSQSERVHYPQYAVLFLGLRYLLGSSLPALGLSATVGILDESFQALVLYADRVNNSLDFKDILLNLLGALLGLFMYAALRGLMRGPGEQLPAGQDETASTP